MATRTNPLISAAALASAAAVAVSTPLVAPSLTAPTPSALSRAAYELTTFADVLSIPPVAISDILFGNTSWGGVLGPENYGGEFAKPQDAFGQYGYVNPWASYCDYNCDVSGIGGVAYLLADALVNGNGEGYDNSDYWNTSIVNYFFEPNTYFLLGAGASPTIQQVFEGWSAASWYALQGTIGQAVPGMTLPLAAAYWGPNNVSVFYNLALSAVAGVSGLVPLVGPVVGNSILAYLGDLSLEQGTQETYQYGLSGALNYWVDLATGAVPWPTKVPWYGYEAPPAAALAPGTRIAAAVAALKASADATPAEAKPVADAPAAVADAPAAEDAKPAAPETTQTVETKQTAEVGESTPAAETDAAETKPSAETDAVETKPSAETDAAESEPAEAAESDAAETKPAAEVVESAPAVKVAADPVVDLPALKAADVAPAEAPAKAAPKRPIRDAVEKVTNQINSNIANAKAAQAERVAARKAKAAAAE